jgi:hypothetical protein
VKSLEVTIKAKADGVASVYLKNFLFLSGIASGILKKADGVASL